MSLSRRALLSGALGLAGAARAEPGPARIAITLDLEMSRNFPRWEDVHWDYEKGNLNAETRAYTEEACRRVKGYGGVVHCFVVGRVLEQGDVGWLERIRAAGHPLGNHTYDHVNVLATKLDDLQFRFRRAPWLLDGHTPTTAIRENIRLTERALQARLGALPDGFRTPGGFPEGLRDRPDLQRLLLDLGYRWVSSKYPAHPMSPAGTRPPREVLAGIVAAQAAAQPFHYPSGLAEVPMSPVSDINAFRNGRWRLEDFLEAVRRAVEWTIDRRACFDFLGHPSCLYVTDPRLRAIELICRLVRESRGRAVLVPASGLVPAR